MAHVVFLPNAAGVIELFPKDKLTTNNRYKILSRWRQLHYISWQNVLEWNYFHQNGMRIPPNVLTFLLRQMINRICNK